MFRGDQFMSRLFIRYKTEPPVCATHVSFFTGSSQSVGPSPRGMKPMTKEEWEKQQSVMRHVYDEESGRTR